MPGKDERGSREVIVKLITRDQPITAETSFDKWIAAFDRSPFGGPPSMRVSVD